MRTDKINFSVAEQQVLLQLAGNTLLRFFKKLPETNDESTIPAALKSSFGLFVSLYHRQKLRGCIGQFKTDQPLNQLIRTMTLAAAFNDHRFAPLRENELSELDIEISVLSPLEPIQSPGELEMGRHGIYIRKGLQSGTYLPQVAQKTGWDAETFVAHCSEHKAGLGAEGWRNAELFRYEAFIFSGPIADDKDWMIEKL